MGFESDRDLASKCGRIGGSTVMKIYGSGYYQYIGSKGGLKVKSDKGTAYFSQLGRLGGLARAAKYRAARLDKSNIKAGERPGDAD